MAKLLSGTRIYGNLQIDTNVAVLGSNVSTSATTGAIVVTGGVGIGGNIHVNSSAGNSIVASGNILATGIFDTFSNIQATTTSTGALQVQGGASFTTGNLYIGGSGGRAITHTGHIIPSSNLAFNLGSTTAWYNTFYGISTQAQYADLAENYAPDKNYEPGTVVVFGGEKEITVTSESHDTRVAGIISTNPGYLMNATAEGIPVAFTGRVPCFVKGPVNKGTVLVTSSIPGVAQAIDFSLYKPGVIIGKSLEEITDTGVKTIEVAVGRF